MMIIQSTKDSVEELYAETRSGRDSRGRMCFNFELFQLTITLDSATTIDCIQQQIEFTNLYYY